jgi:2-polyprenyl-6-hydroxyphenyl methylase/3-demethylubiquinone-9 3-methyltransferase
VNGFFKSYGPSNIKKVLWDKEFSGDKWNFIDNTVGDCVYPYLEKYIDNGCILDLGCGPGNTANELAVTSYGTYVGVDISEAALRKATSRTEKCGRAQKNRFVCGDFVGYVPNQKFNVILFRESMYHVPLGKVKTVLDRYSSYLTNGGVFIVRMNTSDGKGNHKYRPTAMMEVMETEFDVVEKCQHGDSGPTVIVIRPRRPRHKN